MNRITNVLHRATSRDRFIKFMSGLCLAGLAAACTPSAVVTTEVLRPAKVANIAKTSTIVILPLGGDNSSYTSELESLVAGIKIDGESYFTVVDREATNVRQEEWERAANDMADDSNNIEFGNLKIADTMLGGTIIRKKSESNHVENRRKCSSRTDDGKCANYVDYQVRCTKQVAKLGLKLRIINVSTSRVKVEGYELQQDNAYCSDRGNRRDYNAMYDTIFPYILRQVRKDIAPYYQSVDIKLLHKPDDGLKDNKPALEKLENGIVFFRAGQTERGCEAFRQAAGLYGSSHVIYYNLGVCGEINGDFDEALAMYNRAENVSPVDRKILVNIGNAKKRVEVLKRDHQKAISQL